MIIVNNVRNVNEALSEGMLTVASKHAHEQQSRNGPVRVAPGPVVTVTQNPLERVLFSPLRNANPFFHLMESLWMLAGRNDLPWLAYYNRQMATYSDDGGLTQPAAYGHRWRNYFGYDQLEAVLQELTRDPLSRRAVLAMWNAGGDRDNSILVVAGDMIAALSGSKDVPCNTHAYFQLRTVGQGTFLDMTVCNRSNDVLWGAHGANAVHFSVLLEYMAAGLSWRLGFPIKVGTMVQFSNNYHLYTDVIKVTPEKMALDASDHDYYAQKKVVAAPMFSWEDVDIFDKEVGPFCDWASPRKNTQAVRPKWEGLHDFLLTTAAPMVRAWDQHKRAHYPNAIGVAHEIQASDWGLACREWLARARDRRAAKEQ